MQIIYTLRSFKNFSSTCPKFKLFFSIMHKTFKSATGSQKRNLDFENKRLYFRERMRKYSIKGHFYKHKQQGKPRMLKTRRLSWPRSGTQCPWAHLIMEVFLVRYFANSRFDLGQVISALKACFFSCQRKRFVLKKKTLKSLFVNTIKLLSR